MLVLTCSMLTKTFHIQQTNQFSLTHVYKYIQCLLATSMFVLHHGSKGNLDNCIALKLQYHKSEYYDQVDISISATNAFEAIH